jgi:hypothetical protein
MSHTKHKTRTATLHIYTPWGSKNGRAVDVTYRGKRHYSILGHCAQETELMDKARAWSLNFGFTNVKPRRYA